MTGKAIDATGSCLCGAVRYSAKLKSGAGACHCSMCRKWSAGPFMSAHAQGEVEFHGADQIAVSYTHLTLPTKA